MSDSTLSFVNSSTFRNSLLAKNLEPYDVPGVYTPPGGPQAYETVLSSLTVVDSPDNLITDGVFANNLYPLNEFGPNGGYDTNITFNGPPIPVNSNQGEYDPSDTVLDLVNEFYIDAAYIENRYGPDGGFNDMVIITDIQNNNKIYQPYWNPPSYNPSSYSPYTILTSPDPIGSNGPLSQDSFIAKIGAEQLNKAFQARVDAELFQATIGTVNIDSLSDPFEASLIATGSEPLVYRNWRITVPENPIVASVDLATRLASAYWPVSPIPGDYFDDSKGQSQSPQTSLALNVTNQLTGGFLGPILNFRRNPSEIFIANSGNGQRSALFRNINYNRYQPGYEAVLGGAAGIIQGLASLATSIINPNGTLNGGYYVGSRNADPSTITSPPNQIPVNPYGQQVESPVYGPSELGILYEGNQDNLNFGLAAKPLSDGGGIDGQFVWTSPKYKSNAGFKATPGGGTGSLDQEFNLVSAQYTRDESTNFTFKENSILDQTQRLIDSADNVSGLSRLKHVGNAMNQVSKVFHDGYKEMTKGSQVVSYKDDSTGQEAGIEYCRVFTKDTPYYTYADLQKTDGITNSGRRFAWSVFDNTFNLNIAPLKNPGSTNIMPNNDMGLGGYAKKYMFSIENLAWRTSSRPGFTYDELPVCEKGPNGGRVMWFPPYDIKFSDSSSANWNQQSFLGRPEPIYTYKDTSRTGSLSWKMIVDHPSILNIIVDKQLKGINREKLNSMIDSFFAGCLKYDIYQLAQKFNTIPTKDLYTYQEILNNPNLTPEEAKGVQENIQVENNSASTGDGAKTPATQTTQAKTTEDTSGAEFENKFNDLAFYFHNDRPNPDTDRPTSTIDFTTSFNYYQDVEYPKYQSKANSIYDPTSTYCKKNPGYCSDNKPVNQFWDNIILDNWTFIDNTTSGLIESIFTLVDTKQATVAITLIGSASAPASKSYNVNLSSRRVDSVRQYLLNGKGGKLKPFASKITINGKPINESSGPGSNTLGEETTVVPVSAKTKTSGRSVNCTTDIIDGSTGQVTKNSQVYSVDAMACRRVKFTAKVTIPPTPVNVDNLSNTDTPEPTKTIEPKLITPTKPKPTVSIEKKLKDGIGKKILRQLLSECDYFEVIKEEVPMLYDSIREKIKYFNPAFHSMTPEGLNARLTFLNQCVRPGETIPVIDPDGKPKYDNAVNTSFGAPPVLILRIGDFYNGKIIPKSVGFTYEPLVFDMNPEGIGIQPMIANVTLSFDFIGGHGLAKPVEQLQNALSFNYYANTEIYDERSVWTDDSFQKIDQALIKELVNDVPQTGLSAVDNQPQNAFGDTIGTIKNYNNVEGGQNGEIFYQTFMDKQLGVFPGYTSSILNQLESVVKQTNYGVLQLINYGRDYQKGVVKTLGTGTEDLVKIYGKPKLEGNKSSTNGSDSNLFTQLIKTAQKDVDIDTNPIMDELTLTKAPDVTNTERDAIRKNINKYIEKVGVNLSNDIQVIINDIVNLEQDVILNLEKMSLINGTATTTTAVPIDGKKLESGVPLVYNLSGGTGVSETTKKADPTITDTLKELQYDIQKIYIYLKKVSDLYSGTKAPEYKGYNYYVITDGEGTANPNPEYYKGFGDFMPIDKDYLNSPERKRFYMLMARTFNDPNKLNEFNDYVLKTNLTASNKLRKKFEKITDNIAKEFNKELKLEEGLFDNYRKSKEYKNLTDGFEKELYPVGKERVLNYTTVVNTTTNDDSVNRLKALFSDVNSIDGDKTSFFIQSATKIVKKMN
jgi:hypothetical protein